jgi:hypothetical protein
MKSVCKTAKKPNDVLSVVATGGKVALRNLLSTIKSKETPLTGRINKETILLKVV